MLRYVAVLFLLGWTPGACKKASFFVAMPLGGSDDDSAEQGALFMKFMVFMHVRNGLCELSLLLLVRWSSWCGRYLLSFRCLPIPVC